MELLCNVNGNVKWCRHYVENNLVVPQKKLNIKLSIYDPAIPLLGIYPKEWKSVSQRDICPPMFIALFMVVKRWKQLKCPLMTGWINTMWSILTMEYHYLKKKWILTHVTTWMNLEDIMLIEMSQTQKNKNCVILLIYMTTYSSSHVWMWELDYTESWAPKNWCFWTVVLEKTLESPLDCKEIQPVRPKGDQSWVFIGWTDVEVETPILWTPDGKNWLIEKDPDAGKDWRQEEKGMTEDEMVGWHHWLDGHEFEQALEVGNGQGSLACCSPWVCKESDTTEWLNWRIYKRYLE